VRGEVYELDGNSGRVEGVRTLGAGIAFLEKDRYRQWGRRNNNLIGRDRLSYKISSLCAFIASHCQLLVRCHLNRCRHCLIRGHAPKLSQFLLKKIVLKPNLKHSYTFQALRYALSNEQGAESECILLSRSRSHVCNTISIQEILKRLSPIY